MIKGWLNVSQDASASPHPYSICFSLLVFGFHLLQFSKQILCGLREGKHTQSNPLLAKWFLACKMKEVDSSVPSFISGFQQGLVPRGKMSWHLWSAMPVRSSLDSGSFAEDISYPHRITKTFACLLFELISRNLIGKSQGTAMGMIFQTCRLPVNLKENKIKNSFFWKVGRKLTTISN